MEVRRWRIGNTEVVRAVKENAIHMVVKRNSCTTSMDRTVSMDHTVSMDRMVSMDRTVSADLTDVAVAECMGERVVTEKEQAEHFRLILMPRGPRGCMLGCENADTTCFTGRGHTSARNAC